MLKFQVIGLGAAGNKAVAQMIKEGCISANDALIINTNQKDMPPAYIENGGKFADIGNDLIKGAGQERTKGRDAAVMALQNGKLNLDQFLDLTDNSVVLITSTEGGTGSGATPVIAQYIKEVHNLNVLIFAITGFEQSARELWNTIEFFKEMREAYHIEIISNKKFIPDARNNYLKAEVAANIEICRRYEVLVGKRTIKNAVQNIDDQDLLKLVTEPGWGNVEYRKVDEKIKNQQQFNDLVVDMIDETKSYDVNDGSQKRFGIIVSLSEKEQDAIDYSFSEILRKYGNTYEQFRHFPVTDGDDRFIAFISVGMHLPINELESLYAQAQEASSKVNTSADDFFNKISEMDKQSNEAIFDIHEDTRSIEEREKDAAVAKNKFFANFATTAPVETEKKKGPKVKVQNVRSGEMDNY